MFVPQNWTRKGFAHEFTFLDNASRLPFSFPNFSLVRPENFMVCPAEAFNLNSPAFRRKEFVGSEF